ncbi:redoxin family protein [Demequina pelophila]|uniref:redoxin family protein n=1 Tax=Demequina pelophila TaxID=1638984 RepID=UPI000783F22E|nr:redoxin family protein [Demequina pelophila]
MRLAPFLAAPAAALLLASCAASDEPGDDASAGSAPTAAESSPVESAPAESSSASAAAEATDDVMADDAGASEEADAVAEEDGPFAFTAGTVDGGTFEGSGLAGTDVVLWFWAPWCPTCVAEAAEIAAAATDMPDGVPLIGVAGLSEDLEYMGRFVADTGLGDLTHIADTDGSVWRRFDVASQATLLFIDDSGAVEVVGAGVTGADIVERAEALAAS